MRPRYLEIEGLQSFKEVQRIDFDKLGETGLFGIFGPTGSGKSTVLDAITLALFGSVARARHNTQGIINTGSNSVRVSFTFDLLKDGTRRVYRVERLYKRKKDIENSAEARVARLFEVTPPVEIIIADKTSEVTGRVEELIGLRLDDFVRSVVLPQNKFQEFLLSPKADKRAMLERIFYLEEYGRQLTDRVSKKLAAVRYKLSNIEGAMSQLGDASEKALIDTEGNMKAAYEKKSTVAGELAQTEKKFHEAKEIWELVNDLERIKETESQHLSLLEEINRKKRLLEDSVKAQGLTDAIHKHRENIKTIETTKQELQGIYLLLPGLESDLNKAKTAYENGRKEAEEEKPRLIEYKAGLGAALELKKEIDRIEEEVVKLRINYKTLKDKVAAKDLEIKDKRKLLEDIEKKLSENNLKSEKFKVNTGYRSDVQRGVRLEDELRSLESERENRLKKCSELTQKIVELEGKRNGLTQQVLTTREKIEDLVREQQRLEAYKPGDRNDILQAVAVFHNFKSVFEVLKAKKDDLDKIIAKLKTVESLAEQQAAKCREAEARKGLLESRLRECRQVAEELTKQCERNSAYVLAKNLRDGEACPVCGSMHHPDPAAAAVHTDAEEPEQRLKEVREQVSELEGGFRKAENEYIKFLEQYKGTETQLEQLKHDMESVKTGYEEHMRKLPEEVQGSSFDEIASGLSKLTEKNENRIKELESWEKRSEDARNSMEGLNKKLSEQMIEENAVKTELKVLSENLAQTEASLKEAEENRDEKAKLFAEFLGKLKIQNAHNELKRIEESDRQYEQLQEQAKQLDESAKNIRIDLEKLVDERQELASRFAAVEENGISLNGQRKEREQKLQVLSGGKDIELEIRAVDEKIERLTLAERQKFEQMKKLEEQFNNLRIKRSTLENQKNIFERNQEGEVLRLQAALKDRGFESIEHAENSLISPEQHKLYAAEVDEYEKTRRNLEAMKNMRLEKLNGRSLTEEEFNRISELYKAKKREETESISGYESAKNIYNNVKANFERWVTLNRELLEAGKKQEMLESIQKLLKGNGFIEFISEERLRYIAKEASGTLGVLTKYRYALELDSENGFVIRDNSNGGVHRLVSSLSGGETFLTSLALALALSKQIQLKGQSPLEFFFLDEGFGTLDTGLLDTVIDSLERLSSSERTIGLISHVPELKNRMARRLIVEPPAQDGRGSRVSIEKA